MTNRRPLGVTRAVPSRGPAPGLPWNGLELAEQVMLLM